MAVKNGSSNRIKKLNHSDELAASIAELDRIRKPIPFNHNGEFAFEVWKVAKAEWTFFEHGQDLMDALAIAVSASGTPGESLVVKAWNNVYAVVTGSGCWLANAPADPCNDGEG